MIIGPKVRVTLIELLIATQTDYGAVMLPQQARAIVIAALRITWLMYLWGLKL